MSPARTPGTTAERWASNAILTLAARASLPLLSAALLWFMQETVAIRRELLVLSERQVSIAARVTEAIGEDRRRIEILETARERGVTDLQRVAATVSDLNGALRETNALMRGLESRMGLVRSRAGTP